MMKQTLLIVMMLLSQVVSASEVKVNTKESTYTLKASALKVTAEAIIQNLDDSITLISPRFVIADQYLAVSGNEVSVLGLCKLLGKSKASNIDHSSTAHNVMITADAVIKDLYSKAYYNLDLVTCK